jgi:8-oxoguanine DNA glycosylase-like protein
VCSTLCRTPTPDFKPPPAQLLKGGRSMGMRAWATTASPGCRTSDLAFGTKFLYFCSATSSQPALILDRLVARWLRENAGLPLNELRWSVSTYVRYLEIMFGWADELALAADELELCIFSTQAGGVGDSQWAPG